MTFVRSYPSVFGEEEEIESLFAAEDDSWMLGDWLTELGWMGSLGREGGLFVTIGRV